LLFDSWQIVSFILPHSSALYLGRRWESQGVLTFDIKEVQYMQPLIYVRKPLLQPKPQMLWAP
jgi:hypothetical protein